MKKQNGYSITELLLSLGLAGLVSMVTIAAMTAISKRQNLLQTKTTDYIDKTLAERMILLDLRNAEPSFNVLKNIGDDQGLEFYEHFSDVATKSLAKPSRSLTMSLDKDKFPTAKNEMYFLATDIRNGAIPLIMYEPSRAYELGSEPADPMQSATLTYRGLNYQSWVVGQLGTGYWKTNQLFILSAEVSLRPLGANETVVPSRSPAFVGMVSGSGDLVPVPGHEDRFEYRMPWDLNQSFTNPDLYLRMLPPSGGAVPDVRMMAVKLLRYTLEADAAGGAKLYREMFDGSKWANKFLIINELHWLQFERPEVTSKAISFALAKIAKEK